MSQEQIVESKPLDEVKKQYFRDFEVARASLFAINRKRVQTPKAKNFGVAEASFKAGVLKLFDACCVKFSYHESNASVKQLIELEPRISYRISLEDAERVFKLLTVFLEIDGVTRFEEEKHVSKPY